MLNIYKSSGGAFTNIDELAEGVWIDLVSPTEEQISRVSDFYDIPRDFLIAALDEEERSRLELEDGNLLILVDVPIPLHNERTHMFNTIPFGIIVADQTIITICLEQIPVVEDFLTGKVKGFSTKKKSRFVLQLLHRVATNFLQYLRVIDRRSSEVETELHKSMKNQELIQLLDLEKSLVYFSTSLTGNEAVLEKLLRLDFIKRYPDDEDLLEDVIIENKQAMEMASIYTNILSGTMDAFASIISNNLNIVMKILTSITIVLTVPTMIASFYGMNVPLPMSGHPNAFVILMLLSVTLSSVLAFVMFKKKMF